MKNIFKCILITLFIQSSAWAGDGSKLDLVNLKPSQSVLVCFVNEYIPPTEITQHIPIKNTIYPLYLYENTSEIKYTIGVDMSLFARTTLPFYVRSFEGTIVDENLINFDNCDTEFTELSTLAYQHEQLKQMNPPLRFVSLVKQLPNPEPEKRKLTIKASRLMFIVGDIEEIIKSFQIPYNSAFRFSSRYTLE